MILRELEALRTLSKHDNIVNLTEVIQGNDCEIQFVFEYMPDGSLFDLIKKWSSSSNDNNKKWSRHPNNNDSSSPRMMKNIMRQIFSGLHHIHSNGFLHRDIKPENILLDGQRVKIADFGLSRQVTNAVDPLTEYISTRWYRAPEVLLHSPRYGPAIDIFAAGCVMAELVTLTPLFPGTSELDQIYKIFSVLGNLQLFDNHTSTTSTSVDWCLFNNVNTNNSLTRLSNILSTQDPLLLSIITSLLRLDPNGRLSAADALQHPFLSQPRPPPAYTTMTSFPIQMTPVSHQDNIFRKRNLESMLLTTDLTLPFADSTGFDDDDDDEDGTSDNNTIVVSRHTTPGLDSVGSAAQFDSTDVLSYLNDIRKDLLSSDSHQQYDTTHHPYTATTTADPLYNNHMMAHLSTGKEFHVDGDNALHYNSVISCPPQTNLLPLDYIRMYPLESHPPITSQRTKRRRIESPTHKGFGRSKFGRL